MIEGTSRGKAPVRVLIVDDNEDARLLVRTFLSLLGFHVCTAADGLEAVSLAEQFKPDVVFLDLWMPNIDGVETCLRLRDGPCPRPIPIFAVTADVQRAEDLAPCFDRVLTKPVDLDFLADLAGRCAKVPGPAPRRLH